MIRELRRIFHIRATIDSPTLNFYVETLIRCRNADLKKIHREAVLEQFAIQ